MLRRRRETATDFHMTGCPDGLIAPTVRRIHKIGPLVFRPRASPGTGVIGGAHRALVVTRNPRFLLIQDDANLESLAAQDSSSVV